jgi:hypothetical protein
VGIVSFFFGLDWIGLDCGGGGGVGLVPCLRSFVTWNWEINASGAVGGLEVSIFV